MKIINMDFKRLIQQSLLDSSTNGHLNNVIEILHSGDEIWCGELPGIKAASGGYLDIVKVLCNAGAPFTPGAIHAAAENGHINIITWLVEQGCSYSIYGIVDAAKNGHVDVVAWLIKNDVQWIQGLYGDAQRLAYKNGHIDIVKLLQDAIDRDCGLYEDPML